MTFDFCCDLLLVAFCSLVGSFDNIGDSKIWDRELYYQVGEECRTPPPFTHVFCDTFHGCVNAFDFKSCTTLSTNLASRFTISNYWFVDHLSIVFMSVLMWSLYYFWLQDDCSPSANSLWNAILRNLDDMADLAELLLDNNVPNAGI